MISFTIEGATTPNKTTMRRNWLNYTKENLLLEMRKHDWNKDIPDVQACWNDLENKLTGNPPNTPPGMY